MCDKTLCLQLEHSIIPNQILLSLDPSITLRFQYINPSKNSSYGTTKELKSDN